MRGMDEELVAIGAKRFQRVLGHGDRRGRCHRRLLYSRHCPGEYSSGRAPGVLFPRPRHGFEILPIDPAV